MDQGPKKRLVCVCIRSLMTLVQRIPSVRETLTVPVSTVSTWAPWMLKFSFLYMNSCLNENNNATAMKNTYMSGSGSGSGSGSVLSSTDTVPVIQEKGKCPYWYYAILFFPHLFRICTCFICYCYF